MDRIIDALFSIYWPVSRVVSRLWYSRRNPVQRRLPPGSPLTPDDPIMGVIGGIQRFEAEEEAERARKHEHVAGT